LAAAGIMAGKHYVSYPGTEQAIEGGIYEQKMTVTDGKIITAIGVGAVLDLALEIIEQVLGKERRDRIQKNIRYKAFETEK
jgi:4-methyl-5(b-hydroxyethyl)-thiazole monophosphate biosynthesis